MRDFSEHDFITALRAPSQYGPMSRAPTKHWKAEFTKPYADFIEHGLDLSGAAAGTLFAFTSVIGTFSYDS
jgi:hypothetical protein